MKTSMKVLIAYDGSDCSKAAIQDLRKAGFSNDVEALVLSIADVFIPPNGFDEGPVSVSSPILTRKALTDINRAKALADEASKILIKLFPNWQVKTDSFAASPAWGIISKAQEWQADLVVVGAHGLSSTGRLILGSVAQIVATQAPCSVRVVRQRNEDLNSPPRIVIGNDESSDSDQAILEVMSRKWPQGTAVHLITAIESRLTSFLALELEMRKSGDQKKAEFEAMKKFIEAKAEKLRTQGLIVTNLIKEGDPKKVLLDEAERWGADSIFVGVRGLSGIKHLLIGSVSASLVARAHCTVEIVRNKEDSNESKQRR